jgi:ABC-2 type transport system ATP-binding protein
LIVAEKLVKKFEDFVAVDSVDLSVSKGEVMALLGPNGAGKTTTIRMLTSILQPTSGQATVNGYDVVMNPKQVRASVGVLTENHGLYNRMPAYEYLDFFGQLYGLKPGERKDRIDQLLTRFNLGGAAQKRVGEFSKGMRQKLALARSLLHNPPVLLLDEPTSAMDPESARLVRNMIKDLKTDERTILICTHNLSEAEELADRITIIRDGRIIESGTPTDLKQKLLGSPLFEIKFSRKVESFDESIFNLVNVIYFNSHSIQYTCDQPEEITPQLLDILVGQGARIVFVREVPRSLENIYLQAVSNGGEIAS